MGRKPSPPDKDPTPHGSISGLILRVLCACAAEWVFAYNVTGGHPAKLIPTFFIVMMPPPPPEPGMRPDPRRDDPDFRRPRHRFLYHVRRNGIARFPRTPVGMCVMRTALSVLLTCWPACAPKIQRAREPRLR